MRSKNGGVSISIMALVLLSITLIMFTLVIFSVRSRDLGKGVGNFVVVEIVKERAEVVNSLIQLMVNRAEDGKGKEEFLNSFEKELSKYKQENGEYYFEEFLQIEQQLDLENVLDDSSEMVFDLRIKGHENQFDVTYEYTKTFIKK